MIKKIYESPWRMPWILTFISECMQWLGGTHSPNQLFFFPKTPFTSQEIFTQDHIRWWGSNRGHRVVQALLAAIPFPSPASSFPAENLMGS